MVQFWAKCLAFRLSWFPCRVLKDNWLTRLPSINRSKIYCLRHEVKKGFRPHLCLCLHGVFLICPFQASKLWEVFWLCAWLPSFPFRANHILPKDETWWHSLYFTSTHLSAAMVSSSRKWRVARESKRKEEIKERYKRMMVVVWWPLIDDECYHNKLDTLPIALLWQCGKFVKNHPSLPFSHFTLFNSIARFWFGEKG